MNKVGSHFSLPSPAKINRFLHIIGRRQDGYHLLQTLFQFLDFSDVLHFEAREDGEIILLPDHMCNIPMQSNLIYRAAKLLQSTIPHPTFGATITVDKQIPLGAGLGGGSSNAATALLGLNKLWGLGLSSAALLTLGTQLGADISVFLRGQAALGEGIGDRLTLVEALDEPWIVLLSPACEVATAKMYAHSDLTRNTPAFTIGTLTGDEIKSIVRAGKNDFEPVVCRDFPEVDNAMKWLSNFGKAQLSGSGASVFACFEKETAAQDVLNQLPSSLTGRVVKAMNVSPLKMVLAA